MAVVIGFTIVTMPITVPDQMEKQREKMEVFAKTKKEIGFGSQIRSYVLHPYRMVKDHRTGCEPGNTDAVLDGDLDRFIEAYLLQKIAA